MELCKDNNESYVSFPVVTDTVAFMSYPRYKHEDKHSAWLQREDYDKIKFFCRQIVSHLLLIDNTEHH